MSDIVYEFQIKQRGGKWAPQCQKHADDVSETWERMKLMKRKLRCVKFQDGKRIVIAKYEPPPVVA